QGFGRVGITMRNPFIFRISVVLAWALGILTAPQTLRGDFLYTSIGSDPAGDPVDAQAQFIVTAGQVEVILSDLQGDQHDAGQLVSQLQFNVSGATGLTSFTGTGVTANIAQEVIQKGKHGAPSTIISPNGKYAPVAATPGNLTVKDGWKDNGSSGSS